MVVGIVGIVYGVVILSASLAGFNYISQYSMFVPWYVGVCVGAAFADGVYEIVKSVIKLMKPKS